MFSSDDEVYLTVAKELSANKRDEALWLKACYANRAGECELLGITTGMSPAQIQGRLGKPDSEKLENATLIWDYASRNVLIYFSKNNAYMIKVENPFNRFDK